MWQVKAGSYFAFLKRCSELNIPLVQGVRAVLRFRLLHFIPGLCHTVLRKRMLDCLRILWDGALRKDLRHWAFSISLSCFHVPDTDERSNPFPSSPLTFYFYLSSYPLPHSTPPFFATCLTSDITERDYWCRKLSWVLGWTNHALHGGS